MTDRPRIAPDLLAALLEAAPARVRRKLDAAPRTAEGWPWSGGDGTWTVAAGGETVTLTGTDLTEPGHVACTCLLGPRCLHLLAVAGLLDAVEDDGPVPETSSTPPASASPDPLTEVVEVDPAGRAAAHAAWDAAARVLAAGVRSAGSGRRAELLRASALARAAHLPRLSAACVAVAAGPRDHPTPAFDLSAYVADLTDLLDLSLRLGGGPAGDRPPPTRADVGVARRAYTEVGSLRLYGLGGERVVTASGYAGVVTHLVSVSDGAPRLWRVADVAPGDADRVTAAHGSRVSFGGIALSHRDLGRGALIAQRAGASADGRLSGMSATTAATIDPIPWDEGPLAALWERPLADQVADALAALAAPTRRSGSDLVFAGFSVVGPHPEGVEVVETREGRPHVLVADGPRDPLRARNLARIGLNRGTVLRVMARPVPERPGRLIPLTVSGLTGLPDTRRGRLDVSLDTLKWADPAPAAPTAAPAPLPVPSPKAEAALARVLSRFAEAGRETVSVDTAAIARLRAHHLPTGADLLTAVIAAARERVRTVTGESVVPSPDGAAVAWLAASTYLNAVRARLNALAWAG
ncbi:hypothetical protein PWG71_20145 [Nocardiopsis sp. N85]|uniref:hypothetical protein n=1 Tax=Nocardiopsis sp. N85 TaxID=3029400 RepID=UPI00237F41C4|nr:hypothetical protein [Nocardiopsis sp. N85]MDE3723708.1 hypothetical protein [Nocardiopsis sp. N85]